VDVIIGSSSSDILKQIIIEAAGNEAETVYETEIKNNPNSLIISTPPGHLSCKRIFFLKWQPSKDDNILRQSIIDFISNVIQNVISYNYKSIAFPALGCGKHGCSTDIVVKTMVREIKSQLKVRQNYPLIVKFIIQPEQQNIYDEFCKYVVAVEDDVHKSSAVIHHQLPETWEKSTDENKILFIVPSSSNEHKTIVNGFDQTMKGKYTQIIKIERIQNIHWYSQYMVHSHHFKKRLNSDTEKRLYHGCPEKSANLIMEDCFNRSFAGVNG
ncbi:unnamed protein product, partial [Didymodactylos carnosus]